MLCILAQCFDLFLSALVLMDVIYALPPDHIPLKFRLTEEKKQRKQQINNFNSKTTLNGHG